MSESTLISSARRFAGRVLRRLYGNPVSSRYQILETPQVGTHLHGWKSQAVAQRQQQAFAPLLAKMRDGHARADFLALAAGVKQTGLSHPSMLEIGCGGGWNWEVLEYLLQRPARYVGVDYSIEMIASALQSYPKGAFCAGDACDLPFEDNAFDIVVSGTVLMHLVEYRRAIRECRRVARSHCIFHTVPVTTSRATTFLSKDAYGEPVIEVVFNEAELMDCFRQTGMEVQHTQKSIEYDLKGVIGERTTTRTYTCAVVGATSSQFPRQDVR